MIDKNTTVIFASGNFYIRKLIIGKDCRIDFTGNTNLSIQQNLELDKNCQFNQILPQPQVTINFSGNAIAIGKDSSILLALIHAPNATVAIDKNTIFSGSIWSNKIDIGKDCRIIHNESPMDLTIQLPPDIELECPGDTSPANTGFATAISSCSTPVITFSDTSILSVLAPLRELITRTWTAVDACGAIASATQTISIVDSLPPVITLNGPDPQIIECSSPYTELGATAFDACDGDLTSSLILPPSSFDTSVPGSYSLSYSVADASGNSVTVSRSVIVQDTVAPILSSVPHDLQIECGDPLPDPASVTAADTCDPSPIVTFSQDPPFPLFPSVQSVLRTWTAVDASGNSTSAAQTITIVDTFSPVITLTGDNPQIIECPSSYTELGAAAVDACDGDITSSLIIQTSSLNSSNPGDYPVIYTIVDSSGNTASAIRIVSILDTTSPVITLNGANPQIIECHAEVDFIAGPNPGINIIEANFAGNTGKPAVFVVTGLASDPLTPTSFAGQVQDNAGQPIVGAECRLRVNGVFMPAVYSDSDGLFHFENTPSGPGDLFVDGVVATTIGSVPIPLGTFPSLHYEFIVIPNAENRLPMPVLLPRLNPNNAVVWDGTSDVELTCEGMEGLKMIVTAGSMRKADGSLVTPGNPATLSINQVHHDDIPMPIPDGASPPFTWTLQPGGAHFDPPIRIEYPNMTGMPPGGIAYFLSFNHDTSRFEIVSSGHITADGSTIVTDPGGGNATVDIYLARS